MKNILFVILLCSCFIKLHSFSGKLVLVNVDDIQSVQERNTETTVYFKSDRRGGWTAIDVKESVEEIHSLIKKCENFK